jgi:hypothetical protein
VITPQDTRRMVGSVEVFRDFGMNVERRKCRSGFDLSILSSSVLCGTRVRCGEVLFEATGLLRSTRGQVREKAMGVDD